jgi:hypothetical protein
MTEVGGALLTWLTGGSALAALSKVLLGVCALVFGLVYRRYLGILGADRRRPAERQAYNALRGSLAEGNMAARLYAQRLSPFLDVVDRFFGDAGMADRTLFPHAFGLRTPAPLWTAPAFDRCLLLAFVYPVAAIFMIWAISGHVGPAEAAFGLKPNLAGWERGLAAAGASFAIFRWWRLLQIFEVQIFNHGIMPPLSSLVSVWLRFLWTKRWVVTVNVLLSLIVILGVYYVSGAVVAFITLLLTIVFGTINSNAVPDFRLRRIVFDPDPWSGTGSVAVSMVVFVSFIFMLGLSSEQALLAGGAVALIHVTNFSRKTGLPEGARLRRAISFPFYWVFMFGACLMLGYATAPLETWGQAGPILLFLGVLTLLNAPFDWSSPGLDASTAATRARTRRLVALFSGAAGCVYCRSNHRGSRAHDGRWSAGF